MAETSVCQSLELRRCEACGHEYTRPRRLERTGEVPCPCGTSSFKIFDLLLVERELAGDEADLLAGQRVGIPPTRRSHP